MKTFLFQKANPKKMLPSKFIDDGRMEPELLEKIIERFSKGSDIIFDPFMGYGTLIEVCNSKDRLFIGVEKDAAKYEYIKDNINIKNFTIINSDIMDVDPNSLPTVDLIITSPTYAWKNVGKNPFNDDANDNYYEDYLNYIEKYFKKISMFIKKNGYLILEVSNVEWNGILTTLAWDIANTLNKINNLKQEKEIVVNWDNENEGFGGGTYGFGYDHSYLLVYKKI